MKTPVSTAYLPGLRLDALPFTCAPVPDETTDSYLHRLARLNDTDTRLLTEIASDDMGEVTASHLSTLSGQPTRSLRLAMLQLCTTEQLAVMPIAGRPRPGVNRRPMCAHCARSRGAALVPICSARHEDIVCLRHRRWVGRAHEEGRQPDLTGYPVILAAARRHRLMIRRLGRKPVLGAFVHATELCHYWLERRLAYSRRGEVPDDSMGPAAVCASVIV